MKFHMENGKSESRGRVLFADDDRALREGLAIMLRRFGFECHCVSTAVEAVEVLRAVEFEVLISDINMPGNVGLELIETLPQVAAGLPVILLTGKPTIDTAVRSVRLAVTAYLTKPPDFDELCCVLDKAVADHRGFRAMHLGRERLRTWEKELAQIEQVFRQTPGAQPGGPMGSYLRVSLRQVILMLADIEKATHALERRTAGSLDHVDHIAALRRTVEVLERTKQNFKSKDLADLRRQLEQLLEKESDPGPVI